MDDLLYKETTYDIRGACFAVWKAFAGAFKEKVAERALAIELRKRGRKVETQKKIVILYEKENVGYYVPDVIVDDVVLVEIKSKEFLTAEDYDQFWKYLKGSRYRVGLLVNFGPKKLEIKRVVYDSARDTVSASFPRSNPRQSAEKGFTLMEIMVASTIFVIVAVALLSLFNYVLKINRRADALRQASQSTRNFVESLVKEIRNGQVDYFVNGDQFYGNNINHGIPQAPCHPPGNPGDAVTNVPTYQTKSNWLGIINTDNVEECFYYAKADGHTYVDGIGTSPTVFSSAGGGVNLAMEKDGVSAVQTLNPPNARVDNLVFLVTPQNDPYSKVSGSLPKIQPAVEMIIKFVVQLPTGEQVLMYYQTAVSENKYDIPNK
jgi:GxxExxY protein